MEHYDVVVVGAGIVGLATARAALDGGTGRRVLVVDKEGSLAGHQSSRNSGVIHAGVYYKPGSEKARLCSAGRRSMVEYCRDHGIDHAITGKLVVAVDQAEGNRLDELERRCVANGVRTRPLARDELREVEPHVAGLRALHVLDTGIADYPAVCRSFAADIEALGGEVRLGAALTGGTERADRLIVETTAGAVSAERVVACAGLHADRVARTLSGPQGDNGIRIVPFRGEYYELQPSRTHLVRTLIYPVPDPQFPFLGVHLTRGVNGRVHLGPNAVLALAREGYSWHHRDLADVREIVAFPGFRALAKRHWRYGLSEMVRSLSTRRFTHALQRLVPEITEDDLEPASAGVRAQAVFADGSLADDFVFHRVGRALHVLNAPSPAATASLEIGRQIARTIAG